MAFWTFTPISPKNADMYCTTESSPSLIIQLARFGDLIQTKRLMLSLARLGPVHLLVDSSLAELARLVYPQAIVHHVRAHATQGLPDVSAVHDVFGELAGFSFAHVHNLNLSGMNFAISAMFPGERVRGYRQENGQRFMDDWPALTMRWIRDRTSSGINLVDVWGLAASEPVDPESVNPEATPRGGGIGVVMAGQHARRSLPPKILAPLLSAALNRIGHGPVLLLGAGAEARAAKELIALLPPSVAGQVRDLVGRTSWAELFDVVGSLDLLLSPDTGTMHLAAHLGVPIMAFFLSSAWCHETGPYGYGHLVLQAMESCAPCMEKAPCPHHVRCLEPFAEPALLRWVSGRQNKELPERLAIMSSGFDRLGAVYNAISGCDRHDPVRTNFRDLVAGLQGMRPARVAIRPDWFQERDWMLPSTLRGHVHE